MGLAAFLALRKRDPEEDEAVRVWLDASWPRWGLPQKAFALLWCLVMYPLLAYILAAFSRTASRDSAVLWAAAAIHLVANVIWVPSFAKWQAASLAVVSSLVMVLSAVFAALMIASEVSGRTRALLWVYVAWVAYSASITSSYLFADSF